MVRLAGRSTQVLMGRVNSWHVPVKLAPVQARAWDKNVSKESGRITSLRLHDATIGAMV